MSAIDDIEFKICRLDLRSGDVLVVKIDVILSAETAHRIHEVINKATRGHKALILERGMDLAVLTAAEIEARTAQGTD